MGSGRNQWHFGNAFDLRKKTLDRDELSPVSVEFPRVAPSVLGRRRRHVYLAAHSSKESARRGLFDEVAHFDYERGTLEHVSLGREQYRRRRSS